MRSIQSDYIRQVQRSCSDAVSRFVYNTQIFISLYNTTYILFPFVWGSHNSFYCVRRVRFIDLQWNCRYFTCAAYTCQQVKLTQTACFRQQNRQPYGAGLGTPIEPRRPVGAGLHITDILCATQRKSESRRRQKTPCRKRSRWCSETRDFDTETHTHDVIKGKEAKEESTVLCLENS